MKKVIWIAILILIITPFVTFAAPIPSTAGCTPNSGLGQCINQIYVWSLGVAGILALFMIIFGGYTTLTSAGNAQRAEAGKKYITSSIIGLILLFGAYLLLNTINPDLVNFNFDINNAFSNNQSQNAATAPRSQ